MRLLETESSNVVAAVVIRGSRLLHTGDEPLITGKTLEIELDEGDTSGGSHQASQEDVFSS